MRKECPQMLEQEASRECANCGSREGLLRCSRCRSAFFCSIKCQKAIWPFHRQECLKNEFADAVEEAEPKFAAWMRKHGKQATLKDDEVDRLERAGKASTGTSRAEVMESMYGRFKPTPKEASYTAEERKALQVRDEAAKLKERLDAEHNKVWDALEVDVQLGMHCENYKWQQNQSHVEIYIHTPEGITSKQIEVVLKPSEISIFVNMRPILRGKLFANIKEEESTWYLDGRILVLLLLKSNRRGHYKNGCTNAATFWQSVLSKPAPNESLLDSDPPVNYYSSHWEDSGSPAL